MAVRRLVPVLVVALLGVVPVAGRLATAANGPAVPEGTVVSFGEVVPAAGGTAPPLDDLVSVASTPSGLGWVVAAADGAVAVAGDATHLGDARGSNAPVVAVVAAPRGGGYWLAGADGGVFAFGSAPFAGSAGAIALQRPVVGMAATPTGRGYWLVASDGGVFAYGDAPFAGSAGAIRLQSPMVGMAPTPSGRGYWLVAADGGVFTFGDARFLGAGAPGTTAMAPSPSGRGYWLLGADGTVRSFGDARDGDDLAGRVPDAAAVSIAPTGGLNAGGYRIGVGRTRDVLTVWQPGGLGSAAEAWARDVAARAGGRASLRHRSNIDIPAPGGWRIPLTLTTVEPAVAGPLVGPKASAALARGEAVLGREAARIRGMDVGATIELLARNGTVQTRRVGAIVDDGRLAWAEIALATGDAARLGVNRPFAVDVWGVSRAAVEEALAGAPPQPTRLGVDRSWDAPSPDATLASAQLKQLVGEVAYRPGSGDGVALDPAWVRANIVTESVPALGRVTCARAIMPALRGALTDVVNAGLAGSLGRYGGCSNPRLIRGGDSGGILSRHSYGIAVDVNIDRNAFGGRVELHPGIVDIFRRWGFAWGGTWIRADGMHLEYAPG